ncbi:MAG: hypothetical protein LBG15_05430 [Dysgonamonadaceae bacterium]|jgi:predicted Holliday junction resolvase-like endonuclease|nr:hypothetical protein [Dysgonamonadaceae bacterium]
MKKTLFSFLMVAVLAISMSVSAQDVKKEYSKVTKKECTEAKKGKKECTEAKKAEKCEKKEATCSKKENGEKKACCAKKEATAETKSCGKK